MSQRAAPPRLLAIFSPLLRWRLLAMIRTGMLPGMAVGRTHGIAKIASFEWLRLPRLGRSNALIATTIGKDAGSACGCGTMPPELARRPAISVLCMTDGTL